MKSHDEIRELLGALALDAVGTEERAELELHVEQCPRCRSELDSMRGVAAMMGNTVESLPDSLWSGISSRLYERRDEIAPPMPRLVLGGPGHDATTPFETRGATSSRKVRTGFIAFALAAAAAVIALSLSLAGANSRVAHLQGALDAGARTAVVAALETPGHKIVNLNSANSRGVAQFVMLPDGRGYLIKSSLPGLPSKATYQLWAIVGGRPISIGLMGSSPNLVTFTMAGSPSPTALAVTVEPSGGSPSPTSPVVASGAV